MPQQSLIPKTPTEQAIPTPAAQNSLNVKLLKKIFQNHC
jgi:hypothetical protein